MALEYSYPITFTNELPFWTSFYCSEYSVINEKRTRSHIKANPILTIHLPFTSEPKMALKHEYAQGTNPVGPVLSLAGLKNTSGGDDTFLERLSAPSAAFFESTFTTDTYRRFSNITELTMTSEARREYYFRYLFVPKSQDEANVVDNIVRSFRNFSYPKAVENLPERSYPQNIWVIEASAINASGASNDALTNIWLGDPLPLVLSSLSVEKGDPNDPVLKFFPDTNSFITLLTLQFTEFETGTYSSRDNKLKSKSEISVDGG